MAGYGLVAAALERRLHRPTRTSGAVYCVVAVAPVVLLGAAASRLTARRPTSRACAVAAAAWTVLGGRSLRRTAEALADRLAAGDLDGARAILPSLCGRDSQSLDVAGLARAAVESVAENTSDAVVAPLFWGAVAGVPGLLGYRAVNTLDAMVGHRSERYARFAFVAARLDDAANLVPARLTAALTLAVAPVVKGSAAAGLRAWRRDAPAHPSPNAGPCEASAAGVLGVRLGGRTVYPYGVDERPVLGEGRRPTVTDIERAARLSHAVELSALTCLAGAAALLSRLTRGAR